jgi:FkbM family methyltransferase
MKISNKINYYHFKNQRFEYTIPNYDYFTTDYGFTNNTTITELHSYTTMLNLLGKINISKSIIDVGANCGLFCIPSSMYGYKVYAFEPISMNVELLNIGKETNNCESLEIIPFGLMDESKKETIYIPYCSDNTSFNKDVAISNMNNKDYVEEIVECITFDKWIEENPLVEIGFIKIDVQGFEKQVLDGMNNYLSNCNDVYIFMEWDKKHTESAGNSLEGIQNLLTSFGFNEVMDFSGDKLFYKN